MGCGGPGILDVPKALSLVEVKVSICEQKNPHIQLTGIFLEK
jgi:hypothetical protein